mmetsp:Transcript_7524/g.21982  ORF Transcript_7524/g.21982 Transcript_7524/m.21982 type:complete len:249 (+) Transcript_7524:1045-1791(+)
MPPPPTTATRPNATALPQTNQIDCSRPQSTQQPSSGSYTARYASPLRGYTFRVPIFGLPLWVGRARRRTAGTSHPSVRQSWRMILIIATPHCAGTSSSKHRITFTAVPSICSPPCCCGSSRPRTSQQQPRRKKQKTPIDDDDHQSQDTSKHLYSQSSIGGCSFSIALRSDSLPRRIYFHPYDDSQQSACSHSMPAAGSCICYKCPSIHLITPSEDHPNGSGHCTTASSYQHSVSVDFMSSHSYWDIRH